MKDLFGDIVDRAVNRLRQFEPADGYYVAYSGGKDSDVILNLVRQANVKYDAHHNLTTCDPPEVVRHVRRQADVVIDRPVCTMWQLIAKKQCPPMRTRRFCCQVLKERGGEGRVVVTGIRWEESRRRSSRKMVEHCFRNINKRFLHPIIDWDSADVWQYLRARQIEYCCLYDEGFLRLGCVLCPMNRDVGLHLSRWPRICRAWERAIKKTWKRGRFTSPDELWMWWLDRDAKAPQQDDTSLFYRD